MKTVLLLGGFGFLGTNILKYIDDKLADKYLVIVFDRFNEHPHGLTFNCVKKIYNGDFTDNIYVRSIFKDNNIDLVIHSLSATVPSFSENIYFDIDANLKPTVGLLNLMKEFEVTRIVFISSGGAIYGDNNSNDLHRESDEVFPKSSYGIVKLAIEKYLFQYSYLYGIQPLVLRLSNPYGPYHYSLKQGVINIALRKGINAENFKVWGDGTARKDYIFVNDFCHILFILLEKEQFNNIFNLASGQNLSVNEILASIKVLFPSFSWEYDIPKEFDVKHFELDISKLRLVIKDFPFVSFADGLSTTLKWIEKDFFSINKL
jgi:UDP-glucose 4-epimerase